MIEKSKKKNNIEEHSHVWTREAGDLVIINLFFFFSLSFVNPFVRYIISGPKCFRFYNLI